MLSLISQMRLKKSPYDILIADDDADDIILFKDAIEQAGISVSLQSFLGGADLMNHFKNVNNPLPDLIFLDLKMHCKNGFECLEEIRNNQRLSNLCIIVYSTSSHSNDIRESLIKGANLYFTKPSTFQELVNRLQRIFTLNWEEFNSNVGMEKFVISNDVQF